MWEYENCTKFIKINLTTTIHIAMMALEQNGNGDTEEGCGVLITRETDYALRVLRALSEGEQLTAGDISEQQMVPKPFAYKIIKKLSKAGFVRITRGADGGCRLAVGLDKVTLYDLMVAMEEDSAVIACMEPGYSCPWREAHGGCMVHCRLGLVQQRLHEELRGHTLQELIFGTAAE